MLDFCDVEYHVSVNPLVKTELTCLPERLTTALKQADEGPLSGMYVGVFLEVLPERKPAIANFALVLLHRAVRSNVSA